MKNVYDMMEEKNATANIENFKMLQSLDHDSKVRHAAKVAQSFYDTISAENKNCHVSVGGLDSITLHYFLDSLGIYVPCISCSSLEDKSLQAVHKKIAEEMQDAFPHWEDDYYGAEHIPTKPEFYFLKPLKPKVQVIKEFGWPVLSKEVAGKIMNLQRQTSKNATVRHAIITGETGEYGGNRSGSRMQLADKWLQKFGGADPEGAALGYSAAPFKVSDRCCYYLKERPCDLWAKEHNSVPYLGLMASEGGRRAKSLQINGCNYYSKAATRSAPFAIFSRQDILQLALDLNVPVPEIYGTIEQKADGTLYTTGAQRTGCSMCGFGIHLEGRPHRFDQLKQSNRKEWDFWMNHVMQDENGEWYGWGRVLDYIGIGWADDPSGQLDGQLDMFGNEIGN
ncbi:MAG: hypothetical protein PWQ08_1104 [Clostridiales bacterium]|nr:hypothetical protein [Clostridiales bacterium]